jgi:hypothetical protein
MCPDILSVFIELNGELQLKYLYDRANEVGENGRGRWSKPGPRMRYRQTPFAECDEENEQARGKKSATAQQTGDQVAMVDIEDPRIAQPADRTAYRRHHGRGPKYGRV